MQVGCEGVVVVSACWLARLAEATPVIGDHPAAIIQENRYLLVPGPAAQRVAVDEHNWLPAPVVLVVQLDRTRVLLADLEVWHGLPRFRSALPIRRTGSRGARRTPGQTDGRLAAHGLRLEDLANGSGGVGSPVHDESRLAAWPDDR